MNEIIMKKEQNTKNNSLNFETIKKNEKKTKNSKDI